MKKLFFCFWVIILSTMQQGLVLGQCVEYESILEQWANALGSDCGNFTQDPNDVLRPWQFMDVCEVRNVYGLEGSGQYISLFDVSGCANMNNSGNIDFIIEGADMDDDTPPNVSFAGNYGDENTSAFCEAICLCWAIEPSGGDNANHATASARYIRSMLPEAHVISHHYGGLSSTFVKIDCDAANYNCKVSTHNYGDYPSVGSIYNNTSKDIDAELYQRPEHVYCQSSGNSGASNNLTYQASAKNIITVGCFSPSSTGVDIAFSGGECCSGPTADGRIKPDLVAYGSFSSYTVPLLAAEAAMVQEYYEQEKGEFPNAAMVKALLIHNAGAQLSTKAPHFQTGWGVADIERTIKHIERDVESGGQQLQELTYAPNTPLYFYVLADGNSDLKATAVWTDPAATNLQETTGSKLVNDIDVRLCEAAGGGVFRSWGMAGNGVADRNGNHRDNVEQVLVYANEVASYINNTQSKLYVLTVDGAAINAQKFALAVSGGRVLGSSQNCGACSSYNKGELTTTACGEAGQLKLSAPTVAGGTYAWYPAEGLSSSSGSEVTVQATGEQVYTYVVRNAVGCIVKIGSIKAYTWKKVTDIWDFVENEEVINQMLLIEGEDGFSIVDKEVVFGENGGLVVAPGSQLIIENATLRGVSDCSFWQGIKVLGTGIYLSPDTSCCPLISPFTSGECEKPDFLTVPYSNGQVRIVNSTIREARIGVEAPTYYQIPSSSNCGYPAYPYYFDMSGGEVLLEGSKFINNKQDVRVMRNSHSPYYTGNLYSAVSKLQIEACIFERYNPEFSIYAEGAGRVHLEGNTWTGYHNNEVVTGSVRNCRGVYTRQSYLHAVDNTLQSLRLGFFSDFPAVDMFGNNTVDACYNIVDFSTYRHNTFKGVMGGIYSMGGFEHWVYDENQFEEIPNYSTLSTVLPTSLQPTDLNNLGFEQLWNPNNSFSPFADNFGVYLVDVLADYKIDNNHFAAEAGQSPVNSAYKRTFGVAVNDGGVGTVNNNTFEESEFGAAFTGNDTLVQLRCNYFGNNGSAHYMNGVAVRQGSIGNQGQCSKDEDGDTDIDDIDIGLNDNPPHGNEWRYAQDNKPERREIFLENGGTMERFDYHKPTPEFQTKPYNVEEEAAIYASLSSQCDIEVKQACDPLTETDKRCDCTLFEPYSNPGAISDIQVIYDEIKPIRGVLADLLNKQEWVKGQIDGGKTEVWIERIHKAKSAAEFSEDLKAEAYLSDAVMMAALERADDDWGTVPLVLILVEQAPFSTPVWAAIQKQQWAEEGYTKLIEAQRTRAQVNLQYLADEIAAQRKLIHILEAYALRYYFQERDYEAALDLLKGSDDFRRRQLLGELYLHFGMRERLASLMEEWAGDYPVYYELMKVRLQWANEGRSVYKMTEEERQILLECAAAVGQAGCIKARQLLAYAAGYSYFQPLEFEVQEPKKESGKSGKGHTGEVLSKAGITVSPNPAVGQVLLKSNRPLRWRVYDIRGVLVYEEQEERSELLLSVSGWRSGLYVVQGSNAAGIWSEKMLVQP